MSEAAAPGPLHGLTVLELADEIGQFCGKLLADLGADVIKVEPAEGESARHIGPFFQDIADPNRSLSFWHYNTSKRGITLTLENAEDADTLRALAADADVVLESRRPGYLAALGLGYDQLSALNPALVMCSLTPFGQTGPWRDYASSDLLHLAAGGEMASSGYDDADIADAPPIAPDGGQAWHTGAHFAYLGIMAALVQRTVTGRGQHVDVSVHEACALTTESAVASYIYRGEVVRRQTGRHHSTRPTPRTQFRCSDGRYVNAFLGALNVGIVARLAEWLHSHGLAQDLLQDKYRDPEVVRASARYIVDEVIGNFVAQLPAEQVYREAQERGFTWGAVLAPDELLEDPHLADRGFWVDVEHPELGRAFTYPGTAAIYGGSPWQITRRAPLLGEHNEEVLGDRKSSGLSDC